MDDAAVLRRTIRRCTAILVVTIGITGGTLASPGDGVLPFLMATIASIYLLVEFLKSLPDYEERDDGSAESTTVDDAGSDL